MYNPQLYSCDLVVDEQPYCAWEWDMKAENLRFLRRLEPAYFAHIVARHLTELEGEGQHHAALAIRLAYSHALESFFALLAAAIQAPQYPSAWLTLYRNDQLRSVVSKLQQGTPIMSRLGVSLQWSQIADEILRFELDDEQKEKAVKSGFATMWTSFAHDFLDQTLIDEYNSIKHGLRISAGGFAFSFGIEHTPGVPCPPEEMSPPSGSVFGSTYFGTQRLTADKTNIRIERHSRNWNPYSLAWGVELLTLSMQNLISYLKLCGGLTGKEVQFRWPSDIEDFEKPWQGCPSMISTSMNIILNPTDIRPHTKQAIRDSYNSAKPSSAGDGT